MREDFSIKAGITPWEFFWKVNKPYRLVASLALLSVIFGVSLHSITPFVFKRIVDGVDGTPGPGPEGVVFWVVGFLIITTASTICMRFSGFFGLRWATGARKTTREILSKYVLKHSHAYFSDHFAGALNSKLSTASEGSKVLVEYILWTWLSFILQLLISLGLAYYANPFVALSFIVWIAFSVPMNLYLAKKKLPLGVLASKAETDLNAVTTDVLTNINAVRDYANENKELSTLFEFINGRRVNGANNWKFSEKILIANNVLELVFTGLMIGGSIYFWNSNFLGAGDLVLVLTLVTTVRSNFTWLGHGFNNFADNLSNMREGLSELVKVHEVQDVEGAKDLSVSSGEIKLEGIKFSYGDRNIFNNLNLLIKPGQRVGLIGRSGSGKSTLMKVLTRQYDLESGSISIDNQDISKATQSSLRREITVVPQEPLLFHRTIRENILYGKLDATEEEIETASKMAQADTFIQSLDKKYETLVGERGIRLSGGEKQRVAIARAFLKKTKILLLDEATSALDSESEILIQKALEKLMEGKTVIAIAHRLSTLRAMDRLIVMDNGNIVEDGTHAELLKKGGIYASLWNHQSGGFIHE